MPTPWRRARCRPDISRWGRSFVVPVGEDSPSLVGNGSTGASPTEYTVVSVMAAEPGTVVNVDRDADGTVDVTSTIDEGETLFVEDILQGATIVASNPVQADFYVADMWARRRDRLHRALAREARPRTATLGRAAA